MIIRKTITAVTSLAAALVMYGAMKNTCPSREQHMNKVASVVEKALDKIFEEKIRIPQESREMADYLSQEVIPQAVERLTSQRIDVTDYGIVSLGSFDDGDGENQPISIGLFGKVFTINEDQAYEHLQQVIGDIDLENLLQPRE